MPLPDDPLRGIDLGMTVTRLLDHLGWQELDRKISINCFYKDPSIKSEPQVPAQVAVGREKGKTKIPPISRRNRLNIKRTAPTWI